MIYKPNDPEDANLRVSKMRMRNTAIEKIALVLCVILAFIFVIQGWLLASAAAAIAAVVIGVVGFCRGELWGRS